VHYYDIKLKFIWVIVMPIMFVVKNKKEGIP
jgi:hypothetical protein